MKSQYPDKFHEPQLKKLWREAFGDGENFIETFLTSAYASSRCRILTDGEQVAAMLFWLDGEYKGQKWAYLYGVATAPRYRGQGLCRRLLAQTHELLACRGYAGTILYPADGDLRQMYGKMGYRNCGGERTWTCAAGDPIPIRTVTQEEYGRLRRRFLPENGLIQEGASLDFLEKTLALYAGENFLLAASVEGKTLTAAELLGREEAAPGITAALGCEKGVFHRGRNGMYTLLQPNTQPPGYVGLVFD